MSKTFDPVKMHFTADLSDSISGYFGADTAGMPFTSLEYYADGKYNNVILLVIGGMSSSSECWNLKNEGPLKRHKIKSINASSTSVPASQGNELMTALEKAGIKTYDMVPDGGDFSCFLNRAKEITAEPGRKFIHMYWPCLEHIPVINDQGTSESEEAKEILASVDESIGGFIEDMQDILLIVTGSIAFKDGEELPHDRMFVPLMAFRPRFFLGTDVEAYVDEAVRRLKKKYPWADKSMFSSQCSYKVEVEDGRKAFISYVDRYDGTFRRDDENWDGELFIKRIMIDQESRIQSANEIKEVLDVRPDYGVDCHGWCLERFEFRSHVLGGYSAFVQAGDRCTGGSREFFFAPDEMSGTFEEFLDKNGELLSGAFGLTRDYMERFKGLKEFLGFKQ